MSRKCLGHCLNQSSLSVWTIPKEVVISSSPDSSVVRVTLPEWWSSTVSQWNFQRIFLLLRLPTKKAVIQSCPLHHKAKYTSNNNYYNFLLLLLWLFITIIWVKGSCSSRWSWICHEDEDDLELLIFLPLFNWVTDTCNYAQHMWY